MTHTEESREEIARIIWVYEDNDGDIWSNARWSRQNKALKNVYRRTADAVLAKLKELNYQKVIYKDQEFTTSTTFKETYCEEIE